MRRTILADDLTGDTENVETVLFSLDGVRYEIDLTDSNAAQLRDTLGTYMDAGRRIGGRFLPSDKPTPKRGRTNEIRDWARANGHKVPDRGRIPASVMDAWNKR